MKFENADLDVEIARLFSDDTRIRIMAALAENGEATNTQLSDMLKKSKSSISYHLRILKNGGFVKVSRRDYEGYGIPMKYYRIRSSLMPFVYAFKPDIEVARLFSDKTRIRILELLAEKKEMSNTQLSKELGIGSPTISYHLKILTDANILHISKVRKKNGSPHKLYSLKNKVSYSTIELKKIVIHGFNAKS
jgi:DNA-binding transcriptional ArsR family regulator